MFEMVSARQAVSLGRATHKACAVVEESATSEPRVFANQMARRVSTNQQIDFRKQWDELKDKADITGKTLHADVQFLIVHSGKMYSHTTEAVPPDSAVPQPARRRKETFRRHRISIMSRAQRIAGGIHADVYVYVERNGRDYSERFDVSVR